MLFFFEDGFVHCLNGSSLPEQEFLDRGSNHFFCKGFIANVADVTSAMDVVLPRSNVQKLLCLIKNFSPVECAKRVAGTASWLFWNKIQTCLWITTDRFGFTPFYFTTTANGWMFSDNIREILEKTGRTRLNRNALVSGAISQYPPLGETYYEDIKQIRPGRVICIRGKNWQEQIYWQPELKPTLHLKDLAEYDSAYRDLFFQIVAQYAPEEQMGITLSSGLDSSSLAAAIRTIRPNKALSAISFISPEIPSANEAGYIKKTCQWLNIQPVYVRADQLWTFKNPEFYTASQASPLLSFYQEVWQAIFEAAQEHDIQVLLGGSGGDQLFGGHTPVYADLLLSLQWSELIRQVREHIARSALPNPWRDIPKYFILSPILNTFGTGWQNRTPQIPAFIKPANRPVVLELARQNKTYRKQMRPVLPGRQFRLDTLTSPVEPRALAAAQIDQASAFNVQMRYPFWDYRLVEFALSLPSDQIYHAGYSKWIVRRALRGKLPEEVLTMFNKVVPSGISQRGLRQRSAETVQSLLINMRLEEMGIVDGAKLRQAYQVYLNGNKNTGFFAPLLVEAWLRKWF